MLDEDLSKTWSSLMLNVTSSFVPLNKSLPLLGHLKNHLRKIVKHDIISQLEAVLNQLQCEIQEFITEETAVGWEHTLLILSEAQRLSITLSTDELLSGVEPLVDHLNEMAQHKCPTFIRHALQSLFSIMNDLWKDYLAQIPTINIDWHDPVKESFVNDSLSICNLIAKQVSLLIHNSF
jgi:hypothetical protein